MTPSSRCARILYLDDCADEHILLRWAARAVAAPIKVRHFTSPEVLQDYLAGQTFFSGVSRGAKPVALLDYNLATTTSLALIKWIRAQETFSRLPVLMYSGTDNPAIVQSCYAAGADFFLHKPAHFERVQALLLATADCFRSRPAEFSSLQALPEYQPLPRECLPAERQPALP